jgi:DNA-binding NtrC family response regulator
MITPLAALVILSPEVAKAKILELLEKSEGRRSVAAERAGIPLRTFKRAIKTLDMYEDIDRLCEEKGWIVRKGGPRNE